jgi:hypothetical protein
MVAWEGSPDGALRIPLGAHMALGNLQRAQVVIRAVVGDDGRNEDDGGNPEEESHEKREPGLGAKNRPRGTRRIRPPNSPRIACRWSHAGIQMKNRPLPISLIAGPAVEAAPRRAQFALALGARKMLFLKFGHAPVAQLDRASDYGEKERFLLVISEPF